MAFIKVEPRTLALVRAPTELNYGEVLLLSQIKSFDDKCFMTNKAFAEALCTSERTIKRWLTDLRNKDLIFVYYEEVGGAERRIIGVKNVPLKGQK